MALDGFPVDRCLAELVDTFLSANERTFPETIVSGLKDYLTSFQLSDLALFATPGPLTLEDLVVSAPTQIQTFLKLFLSWLEKTFDSEKKTPGVLSPEGYLILSRKLITSVFRGDLDGRLRPSALKDLPFPREKLTAAYFNDSMILTPLDLKQVEEFIRQCPNCRLLNLQYNQIGCRQKPSDITAALFSLISANPDLCIDITGNPCISPDFSTLFESIKPDQIRRLVFLSKEDYSTNEHWHDLFQNNPEKDEVVDAVQKCHQWVYGRSQARP